MGTGLEKLDASAIEKVLYDYIKPLLTPHGIKIYGGPRNTEINHPEQVYCNAPIEIKSSNEELSFDSMGKTRVRIEIYASKISGFKNAASLTNIRNIILGEFKGGKTIGNYRFDYINEINGDDRAGFDFIFINLATLII